MESGSLQGDVAPAGARINYGRMSMRNIDIPLSRDSIHVPRIQTRPHFHEGDSCSFCHHSSHERPPDSGLGAGGYLAGDGCQLRGKHPAAAYRDQITARVDAHRGLGADFWHGSLPWLLPPEGGLYVPEIRSWPPQTSPRSFRCQFEAPAQEVIPPT